MVENLTLQNQLCFRLYTAARLVIQSYFPYFKPIGITYPQYLVLLVLWEKDKQHVNEIAARLYLKTNTVTPLLHHMEKQGLIIRKRDKTDSRHRIISLTKRGKDIKEQVKSIPECLNRQLSDKIENYNSLSYMIPFLDTLIEGLSK